MLGHRPGSTLLSVDASNYFGVVVVDADDLRSRSATDLLSLHHFDKLCSLQVRDDFVGADAFLAWWLVLLKSA